MRAQDESLALPTGISTQYLMMEATRLGDEAGEDDGLVLSGEVAPDPHEVLAADPLPLNARPRLSLGQV